MKAKDFFASKPVFTFEEFITEMDSDERSKRTRNTILAYYVKTGQVLNVRKGLYVTIPAGANPSNCPIDPYLIAGKVTEDAVLAYHTALEFYGKAHSIFHTFTYLTAQRPRAFKIRGQQFCAVLFPKALKHKHQQMFDVKEEERRGVNIRVTSLERTMVDLLSRPDLAGGWEELWRSLESIEFFNLDKIVQYCCLLGIATTAAKVGFYLDQHRKELMVEEKHLKPLKRIIPKKPHYLVRTSRKPGRLLTEWNLVIPTQILERSWEEPS